MYENRRSRGFVEESGGVCVFEFVDDVFFGSNIIIVGVEGFG